MITRLATQAELRGWDSLVSAVPGHRVFHTRAWIESIAASREVNPVYLVGENKRDAVSFFPGFIQKLGPLKLFGSPREGWQTESMGPVFDADRISPEDVIDSAVQFLEVELGVDHIELVSNTLGRSAMEARGFKGEDIFSYRVPLHPGDVERTFGELGKKTRNQVRKAEKLGLQARVALHEPEFIDESWEQIQGVFKRRGSRLPFRRQRIVELFRQMGPAGRLLPIWVHEPEGGRCIATGIYLLGGGELNLWAWAHRTEFGSHCPIELLQWTAMKEGLGAGCLSCDMAGGGHAKTKFGATPDLNSHRWMRSRYEWMSVLRKLARQAYRAQQALPGRIARGVGQAVAVKS